MSESKKLPRILVVEDEYLLADDLRRDLSDQGIDVVGPAGSVKDAMALIAGETVDAAVLDITLGREKVFPVAEALTARSIPFVFATGYDEFDLPLAWQGIARFEKPVNALALATNLRTKLELQS